jgi:hypothetical protein
MAAASANLDGIEAKLAANRARPTPSWPGRSGNRESVSFFEAMQLAQSCLNVGLLIAIIVIRRIGKDEIRRGQSALRAEKERLGAHIVAVEKKTDDALKRLHDAELGIAGIRPQLESLSMCASASCKTRWVGARRATTW